MGKTDKETRSFMKDNAHFADAFNYLIYHGEKVIEPDDLVELDTAELAIPYSNDGENAEGVSKYRDILKSATVKQSGNVTYVILGIENQENVHYAMPVRNMLYDALSYTKQVEEKYREHRKDKDLESDAEFLIGLKKTDKIHPVITLVMLWSPGKWDGPESIHEMMNVYDSRILKLVPDYRLNLISPYEMEEDDFGGFQTDLGDALHFIKYASDKAGLENLVTSVNDYRHLDSDAVRVINEVTNAKIKIKKGEKVVDVCQAILDMKKDSYDDGTDNARIDAIKKIMGKFHYTPVQAMEVLDIPKENQDKYMKMLMN